jgi:hypothetical protein
MAKLTKGWPSVMDYTLKAKGIAWDGCHKIYVLMDDNQVELMRKYEYEHIYTLADLIDDSFYNIIFDWYGDSCGLRFVYAVETTETGNPNDGFTDLIEQVYY